MSAACVVVDRAVVVAAARAVEVEGLLADAEGSQEVVVRKDQALLDPEESLDLAGTSLVVAVHMVQVAHSQSLVHLEDRPVESHLYPYALVVDMEESLVRMVVAGRMVVVVVVDAAMVCQHGEVVVLTMHDWWLACTHDR